MQTPVVFCDYHTTSNLWPKSENTALDKMRMHLVLFLVLTFPLPELGNELELMLLKACLILFSSCVLGFSAEPAKLSLLAPQHSVQLEYLPCSFTD